MAFLPFPPHVFAFLSSLSGHIIFFDVLRTITLPVLMLKQFIDPCLFPDGPSAIHACVLSLLLFVMIALVLASTYVPTSTVQCLVKLTVKLVTSYLGENPHVIPDHSRKAFSHKHTLYTV